MRSDIDGLMHKRDLAALLVLCGHDFDPFSTYLTGGVAVTGGYIVKRQGADPILFVNPMETEEAKSAGLAVYSYNDFGWPEAVKAAEGDRAAADIVMIGRYLAHAGIESGRVGVYGTVSAHAFIALLDALRAVYPALTFVGELGIGLFDEAAITKDDAEIARLRSIGQRTNAVMEATWQFIAGHRADAQGGVIADDGTPLTIGAVKRFVRRALLDHDLEDTAMIFAQGRDAGFPHSRGDAHTPLRTGQSIVFDLFPREIGGGYYHDMTRTWCIGYAPPEVQEAYEQVIEAFQIAQDTFWAEIPARDLQEIVQSYFEALGHATTRSQPGATSGYVHSLGHGIGLNIHERPGIGHLSNDTLLPGSVITIEPGLYYPERGFGVRIEDSFVITAAGDLESLSPFHKTLVLPLAGG